MEGKGGGATRAFFDGRLGLDALSLQCLQGVDAESRDVWRDSDDPRCNSRADWPELQDYRLKVEIVLGAKIAPLKTHRCKRRAKCPKPAARKDGASIAATRVWDERGLACRMEDGWWKPSISGGAELGHGP
ncbi:hypothetical protein EYF80_024317 [Liparis tanakae]|uniref:Uncharacterized protein n=1 Tax=Liparis tanakae TaxID=230148 RepID=A0A4Z2HI38_9TELE|nr:hypothetical protein EYF80_024317 [Liparis tanakae]